jgi:hypothetical protein
MNQTAKAPRTQYQIAMANFRSGAYGTPEAPRRGSLFRCAFWDAYFERPGFLAGRHTPGSVCSAHARAGRAAARATLARVQ